MEGHTGGVSLLNFSIFTDSRYAAEYKSGSYPVPLSFPRKRESMFFTDSCFRRNDRVRNVSY
jgi:hypothetical protein